MSITHRHLADKAARWLLERRRCMIAAAEVQVSWAVLDAVGIPALQDQPAREALYDRYQLTIDRATRERRRVSNVQRLPQPPKAPEIVAVEIKRTREDLMADLRDKKMLGYEPLVSHAYLGLDPQVAGPFRRRTDQQRLLEWLSDLGLPKPWGVMVFPEKGNPWVIRPARRLRTPTEAEARATLYLIARSLAWRTVRRSG